MAARTGEQLIVLKVTQAPNQGEHGYAPSLQEPTFETLGDPIIRTPGAEQGARGRQINYTESVEIARRAAAGDVQPAEIVVVRESRAGRKKNIDQRQVQDRIRTLQQNPLKAEAGERFRVAKSEEREDRKSRLQLRNFFWPLMFSRAIVQPIRALEMRERGLLSEKPNQMALNNIEDDLAAAIKTHAPEFDNGFSSVGHLFLRIMRSPLVSYGTSLLSAAPGFNATDVILDGSQTAVDHNNGEGYQRTAQDALVTGIDFFPGTIFFNLGILRKSLGWYNNIVRRGSIRLVREALSDPQSPYYQHRKELARRVLRANVVEKPVNGVPQKVEALSGQLVAERIANHNAQMNGEPPIIIGPRIRLYRRRATNLKWQRNLADVIEVARTIIPDYNPLEEQPLQSTEHPNLIQRAGLWIAQWRAKHQTPQSVTAFN